MSGFMEAAIEFDAIGIDLVTSDSTAFSDMEHATLCLSCAEKRDITESDDFSFIHSDDGRIPSPCEDCGVIVGMTTLSVSHPLITLQDFLEAGAMGLTYTVAEAAGPFDGVYEDLCPRCAVARAIDRGGDRYNWVRQEDAKYKASCCKQCNKVIISAEQHALARAAWDKEYEEDD